MEHDEIKQLLKDLQQIETDLSTQSYASALTNIHTLVNQITQLEQKIYTERVNRYLNHVAEALKDKK